MVVGSNVGFHGAISGAWTRVNKDEVCIYTDKLNTCVVVGNYHNINTKPVMVQALVFNKNGEVLLQESEDGKEFKFTELHPQLVALRLQDFLANIIDCVR